MYGQSFYIRNIDLGKIVPERFDSYEAADYAARVYSSTEEAKFEVV